MFSFRKNQSGFSAQEIILIIVVIAVVALGGWGVYRHNHKTITAITTSNSNTSHNTNTTQQYLTIKEWGVKLPLSSNITDAYYVVSTSTKDSSGNPNTIWLGLKSLDGVGTCAASSANTGSSPLAAIVRALPTDTDPVSGQTYEQKYPNGATVNGYYYGYEDWISSNPCTTQASYKTQLSNINAAFTSATKGIIAQ